MELAPAFPGPVRVPATHHNDLSTTSTTSRICGEKVRGGRPTRAIVFFALAQLRVGRITAFGIGDALVS